MGHAWGDHVGELELRLEAPDERSVFLAAVEAMRELLGDGGDGPRRRFDVTAEGQERAVLLAAWIEELVFLAEHDGVVPVAASDLVLGPASVHAQVSGYHGSPPHLVKAVTYHRLRFDADGTGWRANVVLDV